MTEENYYLTVEGAAHLRAELEQLTGPRRKELAERLRFAIKQGDLSENADYTAAKEEQAFLEGRILELEALLRNAVIIEPPDSPDTVQIGATVVVQEKGGQPETFLIVGMKEADPRHGKISHESPIGKALLGKRAGEIAVAETPGGSIEFKVIEVG